MRRVRGSTPREYSTPTPTHDREEDREVRGRLRYVTSSKVNFWEKEHFQLNQIEIEIMQPQRPPRTELSTTKYRRFCSRYDRVQAVFASVDKLSGCLSSKTRDIEVLRAQTHSVWKLAQKPADPHCGSLKTSHSRIAWLSAIIAHRFSKRKKSNHIQNQTA